MRYEFEFKIGNCYNKWRVSREKEIQKIIRRPSQSTKYRQNTLVIKIIDSRKEALKINKRKKEDEKEKDQSIAKS